MPGSAAKKNATYDDVLASGDNVIAEVIEGVLHTQPRPASAHTRATSVLGIELGGPFDRGRGGPGGWVLLYEPELHLGPNILVPDLAGWRRERMPKIPATAFFDLAPDFVCEVLSPRTTFSDRRYKLPIYAQNLVHHLWLIDPLARSVEVFRLDGSEYRLVSVHGRDERVHLEPFAAIELELAALWIDDESAES